MVTAAFDTFVRHIAVFARMSMRLAAQALGDLGFGRLWWFYLDEFILNGCDTVYVFVVVSRCEVHIEEIHWFFGESILHVDYVSHCVA